METVPRPSALTALRWLASVPSFRRSTTKVMLARLDWPSCCPRHGGFCPTLHAHLKERGVNFADVTSSMDPALKLCQGHEIQLWLDEHPEVTRYAILDDDYDRPHRRTWRAG